MHAVMFERYGGPEVLEYREVPEPSASDGKVLVEIEAAGVNYRDVYEREREGYGEQPPAVIGVEGAGTIAGSGERVAWAHAPGSYAEKVAADRDRLVPVPDGVSSEDAAGGVGLLLTQLAKLRGGRVIATTSTDEKAELAREAGADEVLGYEGFSERVRELTDGMGVAAVYDGVGQATFLEGLKALRPLGRMILYGAASGQPDPLVIQTLAGAGSLYVQRPTLMTYTRTPELLHSRATELFGLIEDGRLKVRIGGRYPLSEARRAHQDLVGRRTTGKLILLPG